MAWALEDIVVLRLKASLASLAVIAIAVSACSSSGNGGSASSTGNPGASGTGASGTGASGGAGLAAAKAATEKNLQEPTTIPLTEPLTSKPPTGKTFVFMKCELDQCQAQADATEAATKALGWTFRAISFQDSDPATLVSGMKQALVYKPVGVVVPGQPEAVWQSVIPAYKAAGVPIVTNFNGPMNYDDTVIGQAGAEATVEWGQMIADWAIADSNGHAQVLLQTVNDYPTAKQFANAYQETMKQNCPACQVTVVNNTISQVVSGQVNDTLVAALQKDPNINYVATCDGPFITGLPAALAAAGLSTRVKISGESGDTSNLANVKAGKESAFTAAALAYAAWLTVDIVLRHMEGMSFQSDGDGGLPTQLLTKDVDFEVSASYNQPADWQAQMEKLWHVG